MKLKVKKLHPDAVIPKYATMGSAGFDLVAIEDVNIPAAMTVLIKTGLSVEIPQGYELQIRPRSGNSLKTMLRVANSPGTVDSDYRGEVCVIGWNADMRDQFDTIRIKKGDKIAQGVISAVYLVEFEEVEDLSDTARGAAGFGSTGK